MLKSATRAALNVTSGVPLRSVLGPRLFLFSANDIAPGVDSNIHVKLFEHDCVVYTVVNATVERAALNENLSLN